MSESSTRNARCVRKRVGGCHAALTLIFCVRTQSRLLLVTPEEISYILIYIRDYYLQGKSYTAPEEEVFEKMMETVANEVGSTIADFADFANTNLVVPMKVARKPVGKASVKK